MKKKISILMIIILLLILSFAGCQKHPLTLNSEFTESEKIDKYLTITVKEISVIDTYDGIIPDDGNLFLKINVVIKDYKNESGKQYIIKMENFSIVTKLNKNASIAKLKSVFSDIEILPGQEKELELVFSMKVYKLKYTECALEFDTSNLPGYNTYIPLNYITKKK